MADDGPQTTEDAGIQARRLSSGGAPSAGGAETNDNPLESSSRIVTGLLGAIGLKINLSTIFNIGLFKQLTPAQSIIDKPINQGAAGLNVRGGGGTNLLAKGLQLDTARDFSKLTKPAIDGFPVQSMSYASLGNLAPQDSGSGRSGIEIG